MGVDDALETRGQTEEFGQGDQVNVWLYNKRNWII